MYFWLYRLIFVALNRSTEAVIQLSKLYEELGLLNLHIMVSMDIGWSILVINISSRSLSNWWMRKGTVSSLILNQILLSNCKVENSLYCLFLPVSIVIPHPPISVLHLWQHVFYRMRTPFHRSWTRYKQECFIQIVWNLLTWIQVRRSLVGVSNTSWIVLTETMSSCGRCTSLK